MFKFIAFLVLFLGGILMLGLATEMPAWQGAMFGGGILVVALSMAIVIHSPSNETRRSRGLDG